MSPDDPRHGERRGYYAHRKDGEDACDRCKRAVASAQARYDLNRIHGISNRTSPVGVKRRLQALYALGWTWRHIAAASVGLSESMVEHLANEPRQYVLIRTAKRIARAYDALCMTRPEGWAADVARRSAAKRGWAPPLAWDDIDTDDEPKGVAA